MRLSGNNRLGVGLCLAACLVTLAVGCSGRVYEGPRRVSVQGKVTLDGEPVDGGAIQFVPVDGALRKASAAITAGRYEIAEAQGPNPGKYRVEVNWSRPTGQVAPGTEGGQRREEAVPESYRRNPRQVELVPGENEFDLAIEMP